MAGQSNKRKGGNKHAQNLRRKERKYKRVRGTPKAGKCGSSYCSKQTGCEPWK
jgi:hypothetical protein